jgi:transposase
VKRAEAAGLTWPLPADLTDAVLEERLFAHAGAKRGLRRRAEPDWATLACELRRPGVNLMVLWEEYRELHPEGYGYSRFCDLAREFAATALAGHAATSRRWRQDLRRLLR